MNNYLITYNGGKTVTVTDIDAKTMVIPPTHATAKEAILVVVIIGLAGIS